MKKINSLLGAIVVNIAALALAGCSVSDGNGANEQSEASVVAESNSAMTVDASSATLQDVGVALWEVEKSENFVHVVAYDTADNKVREFGFNRDGAASVIVEDNTAQTRQVIGADGVLVENGFDAKSVAFFDALSADLSEVAPSRSVAPSDESTKQVQNDPFGCGLTTKCYGIIQYCQYTDWNNTPCGKSFRCGWCIGIW